MALADSLPDGTNLALDTNAFIYYVEEHDEFLAIVEPVFNDIGAGRVVGHASAVTLMEVLVAPLRDNRPDVAARYRSIFGASGNLQLHPLTASVAEQATMLRASYGLSPADAIVAATAVEAGCTHFITNDTKFQNVRNSKSS